MRAERVGAASGGVWKRRRRGTAFSVLRASAIILYQSSPTASHNRGSNPSRRFATPSPPLSNNTLHSLMVSNFVLFVLCFPPSFFSIFNSDGITCSTHPSGPSEVFPVASVRRTSREEDSVLSLARLSDKCRPQHLTMTGRDVWIYCINLLFMFSSSSVMTFSISFSEDFAASIVRHNNEVKHAMTSTRTFSSRSLNRDSNAFPMLYSSQSISRVEARSDLIKQRRQRRAALRTFQLVSSSSSSSSKEAEENAS
mmetsp:Transcript_39118/g.91102  ORF Transcript_39118/g.91102 Transcript_39118/m.91102 type:complete len:254 (-) Transcript_39118:1246-2007(-)